MSVTVTLIEGNTVVCTCVMSRVPCAYEMIAVKENEYHVTSVRHLADSIPVVADVYVMRLGSNENEAKP